MYILRDHDYKYGKHKIGFSKDINTRLMYDRTMVPSIRVRGVFYTHHYELFEKVIKNYRHEIIKDDNVRDCRYSMTFREKYRWNLFTSVNKLIILYKWRNIQLLS